RDRGLLADRRAVGAGAARPARCPVRPPRAVRDGFGRRCPGGICAADVRVLRSGSRWGQAACEARVPRRSPASPAPQGARELDDAGWTRTAVHRDDAAAAARSWADRMARRGTARTRRPRAARSAAAAGLDRRAVVPGGAAVAPAGRDVVLVVVVV